MRTPTIALVNCMPVIMKLRPQKSAYGEWRASVKRSSLSLPVIRAAYQMNIHAAVIRNPL